MVASQRPELIWTIQDNVLESVESPAPTTLPAWLPPTLRRHTQWLYRRTGRLTITENLDDGLGGRAPRVMWRSDDGEAHAQVTVPDATVDEGGCWDPLDRTRWMTWAGFKVTTPFSLDARAGKGHKALSALAISGFHVGRTAPAKSR